MSISALIAAQQTRESKLQGELAALAQEIASVLIKGGDVSELLEKQARLNGELQGIPAIIAQLEAAAEAERLNAQKERYEALQARLTEARAEAQALKDEIAPLQAQLTPLQRELGKVNQRVSDLSDEARDARAALQRAGVVID